jgi:hypothetical protein
LLNKLQQEEKEKQELLNEMEKEKKGKYEF